MFDQTDPIFASAIPLWQNTTGLALEKIARDNKWDHLLAFAEFCGSNSFAGLHDPEEPHKLSVFDICIDKRGISGPKEFLKYCDGLEMPKYLGKYHWTREFVTAVKRGEVDGITFEGVVGKAGQGHELRMAKAKTQRWIDAVKGKFDQATAEQLLNS